jgi:cellulose synthase/poly-beta-1,6-N-acetylglucosamine synthase-like glycosyltransferase
METLFWLSVALLAYGYLGFPLVLFVAGRILDRRVAKRNVTPTITVVVAAYDEAEDIAERIENILQSAYPGDALEVVVASDGSTDATVAIASDFDPERVRVLDLPRRGKAAALAAGVGQARGDVLVFTDANTVFHPEAIAHLARNFADPEVGGVAGHTGYEVPIETEAAGRGEDTYWRYDTWLKTLETRTGSVVSAHGGMYAVRREVFRPVEDASVSDDFAISTAVIVQGGRLVFEPEALAYERSIAKSGVEFRRRVRLMTRGIRSVLLRRELANPLRHGFYSVVFVSHKVLRRLLPLTLPVLLAASSALVGTAPLYTAVAGALGSTCVLALVGWALRDTAPGRLPLFYVPLFFWFANLAATVALWNVARGMRIERWSPQRHGSAAPSDAQVRQPTAGRS